MKKVFGLFGLAAALSVALVFSVQAETLSEAYSLCHARHDPGWEKNIPAYRACINRAQAAARKESEARNYRITHPNPGLDQCRQMVCSHGHNIDQGCMARYNQCITRALRN